MAIIEKRLRIQGRYKVENYLYCKLMPCRSNLVKPPTAILLPGGPGFPHNVMDAYRILLDDANLIFFDPRGTGKSGDTSICANAMENYIDDVERVRESFDISNAIIIGKSCGAMSAIGYAIKYPKNIGKLVLSAGASDHSFIDSAKQYLKENGSIEQVNAFDRLCNGCIKTQKEFIEYLENLANFYSKNTTFNSEKYKAINFCAESCSYGFNNYLKHFNYTSKLKFIKNKTLILAGKYDWITSVDKSLVLNNNIPNSQIEILEKSSHMMESDEPSRYFELIKNFIKA